MTPNRKLTLSLATAMLLFSSGTVFAQDDQRNQAQSRAQQGGLVGALPGSDQTSPALPTEAPSLPIEAPVVRSQTAVAPNQAATAPTTAPSLGTDQAPSVLDAAPSLGAEQAPSVATNQAPSLGTDQAPSIFDASPSLPALGEPAQSQTSAVITEAPDAEKKPGFFKRMWTKVKSFASGLKEKVSNALARNKANRAERAAERAQAESGSQQVFDADIYQGGGDGAGSAAE